MKRTVSRFSYLIALPFLLLPAPSIPRQALDQQVIEAALLDLATTADEDSQTLAGGQGKDKVLFSNQCRDWVGTAKQEVDSAATEAWKSLSLSDRSAAGQAAANVVLRIQNKELFAPFRPGDPHIELWENSPASTQPAETFRFGKRPRPISASPPGYADQRRLAVVIMSFSWSIHSGDATYVLRFDDHKWSVISRHFSYYV
jgi:hypothetical protein